MPTSGHVCPLFKDPYLKFILTLFSSMIFAQGIQIEEVKENDYSMRGFVGSASASDFNKLYTFSGLNKSPYNTNVVGVDMGYKLIENIFDWPFDIYSKMGLSYFDENGHQANFLEVTAYIKLIYKLNAFGNQFRFGIGQGVSYAGRVPYVEAQEAVRENDNQSNFLNYMEITLDFDMGKLFRVKSLKNYHLGYLIKHRSGFHGLYGGVYDGGSNYNSIFVEKNF